MLGLHSSSHRNIGVGVGGGGGGGGSVFGGALRTVI